MLVQCANCGAPLDARPNVTTIKCNYCGTSNARQDLTVQQQQVPIGWQPPTVWVPPAEYGLLAGQSLAYQAGRAARGMQATMILVVLAPFGLTVIGGICMAIVQAVQSSTPSPTVSDNPLASKSWEGKKWDGSTTLGCGTGRTTQNNVTTSKLGIAVHATHECEVDLTNATLRADNPLVSNDHGKIVVHGGTLYASYKAIRAEDFSHIELHNTRIIVGSPQTSAGDIAAIEVSSSGDVELFDCTVEIQHAGTADDATAAHVLGYGDLTIHGGSISGHYRLHALDQGHIVAEGGAQVSGRIDTRGSATVTGVQAANAEGPHTSKHHGHK